MGPGLVEVYGINWYALGSRIGAHTKGIDSQLSSCRPITDPYLLERV